ncbi:MAG TPA: formimidoyltransferase-cyclodeaminase, partial [Acidobacteriota bacterium]|nr:formimidoyltransferase-cyclodeaminase [Acidobacteriota bacterium]
VIDMSKHKGAHPRLGATDVLPFVPIEGVTLEACVAVARSVGERIGRELQIPVFLYEAAASRPERKNLANIRKGEYEGLAEKLRSDEWAPDFGPAVFNPKTGAVICGAREFLIAYNINLNTRDKSAASDIALELREKGRQARLPNPSPYYCKGEPLYYRDDSFPCGNCGFVGRSFEETVHHCRDTHQYDLIELFRLNDADPSRPVGQPVRRKGKFTFCKAIGWYVAEYKRAQISINLTNYKVTPPHLVLEEARKLASQRGLVVTGSEVVGLIPYAALLDAGRYYLAAQGRSPYVPVRDILEAAVFSMGLNDVAPFDINKKVIGLPSRDGNSLPAMPVTDFVDEMSRDTPAPGGGSAAALAGALGAALASMVANITQKSPGTGEREQRLLEIARQAQELKDALLQAIDDDADAYSAYLDAVRLPRQTAEEQESGEQMTQNRLKAAVDVPLKTTRLACEALRIALEAAVHGSSDSGADALAGAALAFAAVQGSAWNVLVNLRDVKDQAFVESVRAEVTRLFKEAEEVRLEVNRFVEQKVVWDESAFSR